MKNMKNKTYKNYRTACFLFIIIIIYILSIQIVYATTDIYVSDSDYYDKAANACLNFENDIFIKGGNVYSINFDKLISSVKSKNQVIGMCINSMSSKEEHNGLSVKLTYTVTKSQYEKTVKLSEKIAKKLEGLTDYQKIKATHDYIINTCSYNLDKAGPYNAFYRGKTNCTGYTTAFQLVMDACNIDCLSVSNEFHAWNIVKLDGQWYNIDLTWDDQDDGIIYDYFLKNNIEFTNHNSSDLCWHDSYNADLSYEFPISDLTKIYKYGIIFVVGSLCIVLCFIKIRQAKELDKIETK